MTKPDETALLRTAHECVNTAHQWSHLPAIKAFWFREASRMFALAELPALAALYEREARRANPPPGIWTRLRAWLRRE